MGEDQFGKDPDVVTPRRLEPYRRVVRSPFRELYKDRLDLLEAAVAVGELQIPVSVRTFCEWASARRIELPPGLTEEPIKEMGEDAAYWKEKCDTAESALKILQRNVGDMWPKSQAGIYMIIIGMAIARFEYKTVGNTHTASAIRTALEDLGIDIGSSTILGHLEDAASLLAVKHDEKIPWRNTKRVKGQIRYRIKICRFRGPFERDNREMSSNNGAAP